MADSQEQPDRPKLGPVPSPPEIVRHLDQFVIGQENAKRQLAIAVTNHFRRLLNEEANLVGEPIVENPDFRDVTIEKSNILLIGPTGCGKTLLARSLAKMLRVPLAIGDATTLTATGYVGEDIESLIRKLLVAADYDIEVAQRGIIFIDEVDKIAAAGGSRSDPTGEGVQQALLKMLEGTSCTVQTHGGPTHPEKEGVEICTENILFICGGAFVGLDEIVANRLGHGKFGFGQNGDAHDDVLRKVLPEDLVKFGMIPELIGRLPVISTLDELTVDELSEILTEPRDALLKQFQKLAAFDCVDLRFNEKAIHEIAVQAKERATGARGLRAVVEEVMEPILFDSTRFLNKEVVVTAEAVRGERGPSVLNRKHRRRRRACA